MYHWIQSVRDYALKVQAARERNSWASFNNVCFYTTPFTNTFYFIQLQVREQLSISVPLIFNTFVFMLSLLQKNAVRKVYRELMNNQEQQEDQENQLAFNLRAR